jgi:methylmalonyl-CoA mutase N-terminal domain/subunit
MVVEEPPVQGRTSSDLPLRPVYGATDVPNGWLESMGEAGEPPFLRGAYPGMYRSKPWRIFQLSGYGDPVDMNARLKFLLASGETGIIVKHDRITDDHLYDADHPEVAERREDVGLTGTVTVGLRDYHTIMDGIAVESVYTKPGGGVCQSAPYTQSCYWSVAMQRGVPLEKLSGTGQSDFFLTYLGCPCKEQIPPRDALRFNLDIIDFVSARMPRWVPVSIAGYNGADSGLNAWQELAAVFANAVEYLDALRARGVQDLTAFATKVAGVNFRTSMDFFEDIAKLRVARKMWSDLLVRRYGITDPAARRLRIHVVTAGSAMTYQEPINNIVRGTVMALSAALGGVQSLGVSGYDEALSIPSDHAHLLSIRIQQILQEEIGLREVVDPLGGSFFLESLSATLEERAWAFFDEIEALGGFIAVIESGWLVRKALEEQSRQLHLVQTGSRGIVGVNTHVVDDPIMEIDGFEGRPGADAWERASARLSTLRRERHTRAAISALRELEHVCRSDRNIIPAMLDVVQADASIGEIGTVFRDVFGNWEFPLSA